MLGRDERRENYRFFLDIPTRWADCDVYGHVNNIVYYSWFDTAIAQMIMDRRLIWMPDSPSIGYCASSGCDFYAEVDFPGTINACVRVTKIGNKSIRHEVGLFVPGREEPVAVGFFIHVFVSRATRKPVELTAAQKAALADVLVEQS